MGYCYSGADGNLAPVILPTQLSWRRDGSGSLRCNDELSFPIILVAGCSLDCFFRDLAVVSQTKRIVGRIKWRRDGWMSAGLNDVLVRGT